MWTTFRGRCEKRRGARKSLYIAPKVCYNKGMNVDMEKAKRAYAENRERFTAFYELLKEYNGRFNLTAIVEEKEALCKHFYDSLAGLSFFEEGASVAEVGSGAGFPSVPLMIARGDLSFTLIESTKKKCVFLEEVKARLGLKAEILCARAEDVGRGPLRERFDAVCARAVASLPTLSEYCLPLVKKGGLFVAYKGPNEYAGSAARAISLLGGSLEGEAHYELPGGYGKRTLVLIRKKKETPPKYPRGQGAERRSPL